MRRLPGFSQWPCRWALRWAFALPLLAPGQAAHAVDAPELKVAIVYNILQFVEWPADVDGSRLTLCVDTAGMLGGYFKALAGRPVNKRQLEVAEMGEGFDSWKQCQAVFLDSGSRRTAGFAARLPRTLPVLVLGDHADGQGLTVHLIESAGRIGFNVDLAAARHARLQISSRLLRLAKKVTE
ncbi:YfiR family protein [Piscinibacter sp. HJYY11]|uniref:YfiR family protein n=1 Tax=Piscinibacter sp. HJYY11 TaxID=2801333 RepID=UPI00191FB603|nr:YfiR family protein [Piscinibacter sp. HJYY11]MBL0726691.1 YfiR family protein [Piscinibacter sp. HJYY11]